MVKQSRTFVKTKFENGFAKGWAFGVSEAFKTALDIRFTPRVLGVRTSLRHNIELLGIEIPKQAFVGDRPALAELERAMRKKNIAVAYRTVNIADDGRVTVTLNIETEGNPGSFSFAAGDMLHEPLEARLLPWGEALPSLSRSLQVIEATPDSYSETSQEGKPGVVKAVLRKYKNGELLDCYTLVCSQANFVQMLREGIEPTAL
ncbi:MAG: hypothetical protein ING82_06980 [Roseomonas sp.]|nr:hypothetical protein [Roseomonas sp.]